MLRRIRGMTFGLDQIIDGGGKHWTGASKSSRRRRTFQQVENACHNDRAKNSQREFQQQARDCQ
jgi:hypothetical protein